MAGFAEFSRNQFLLKSPKLRKRSVRFLQKSPKVKNGSDAVWTALVLVDTQFDKLYEIKGAVQ